MSLGAAWASRGPARSIAMDPGPGPLRPEPFELPPRPIVVLVTSRYDTRLYTCANQGDPSSVRTDGICTLIATTPSGKTGPSSLLYNGLTCVPRFCQFGRLSVSLSLLPGFAPRRTHGTSPPLSWCRVSGLFFSPLLTAFPPPGANLVSREPVPTGGRPTLERVMIAVRRSFLPFSPL